MRYNPVMAKIIDLTTTLNRKTTEEEVFSRSHYDVEIIKLQGYDNFYSLMDRLNQRDASGQGAQRMLLVWPARGRILETPMEFGRLRAWAVRNHYEIALVIPGDDVSLKMAKEQGIPAFKSISEANEVKWQSPAELPEIEDPAERSRNLALLRKDIEQAQRPKTSVGLRLLFTLLALASIALAGYAIIPHARVDITPYLTKKSINMTIWTDDRLDTPTLAGGIPTVEKKLELSLTAVVPASGRVKIESGIAVGEITVRNTCDRIYASSAGVQVGTSEDFDQGINFITLDDAILDPGEERTLRVEAVRGGEAWNLPAGSIRYAEYPKSLCWEVRQTKPTANGSEGVYAAPNDADRLAARENINAQIKQAALDALANDPEGNDLIPLGEPVVTAVKQEQIQPDQGFASETLTMRQTLEVSVRTVRRSDMESIIRGQSARMNLQSAGMTGYEILSGPRAENGLSTWSIRADYLVYEPQTNEEALRIMLRGKTLAQANDILKTLEHVKSYNITMLPSKLRMMPLAAQNIRVNIYPAVEAEP